MLVVLVLCIQVDVCLRSSNQSLLHLRLNSVQLSVKDRGTVFV